MLGSYSRFLAAVVFLAALSAQAKTSICSPAYESQIRHAFYSGNAVSPSKVDAYVARLEKKKSEIAGIIAGKEELKAADKGEVAKKKKIDESIAKSKSLFALDQAIIAAKSIKSATSFAAVCDAAQTVSDLEGALRFEGANLPFEEMWIAAKTILASWKIPKHSSASEEASNLVDSRGNILSADDIAAARARGEDISVLQPAPGSVFYTPIANIGAVDMNKASLGQTLPIYEGIGDPYPADNTFIYEDVKKSDTKPKIDASVEGVKDFKYKVKFQAEYNADPTINSLMMAMGFPGDLSKYAKHIKVVLPKDVSLHDFKREWEGYFSRDAVRVNGNGKIESLIESQSVDAKGRTVLTFKEGMIEVHPDKLKRVGPWKYADGDHNSRREVRGMTIIQMWVDNSDLKESENSNMLLRENADGSTTRVLFNSDVGHSFGGLLLESPSMYPWNMVSSTSGDNISFRYHAMHPVSIKKKITLADARWAARLIAQLSRAQIAQAVAIGGWPDCVAKAMVERMISRRNDLVSSLGLLGAKQADGSSIALLPVSQDHKAFDIENICKWDSRGDQGTAKYGVSAGEFLAPIMIGAKRQLLDLARLSLGGSRRLVISSKDFQWDGTIRPIAEVLFDVEREVQRNPSPTSEQDLFIVKDTFEIGVRAGVSVGPYADVTEKYSYELAYAARSQQEALTNNGFIINLLLPADARTGKLPESYVLKTEHSFEIGKGIQIDSQIAAVSPVIQAGIGKINAWRSIYDHRDGKQAVLYRDRQDYTKAEFDIFARIAILKTPILRMINEWGNALGKGVLLSEKDLKDPKTAAAVDKAVISGDFSDLSSRETDFFTNDEFKHTRRRWNLLFWKQHTENRLDHVQINTEKDRDVVQFKTSKGSELSFFSSVRKDVAVEVYADPATPSNLELQVNVMGTDAKTSDDEMANKYLRFINGLSLDGTPVIALTPSLGYTTNGNWGDTLTQSDTTYSANAMSRILKATPEAFWNAVSASMRISRATLNSLRHGSRTHAQDLVIDHANEFLKNIAKARAESKLEKKISKLALAFRKAIYLDKAGFYNPTLLGALNRIAGVDEIYSRNMMTVPDPKSIDLPEGTPAFGRIGTPPKESLKYLIYAPMTASDLYTMFDTWF